MRDRDHQSPHRKGFTLIELLVACALFSIILVVMFMVISSASSLSASSTAQIDAIRTARESLNLIGRDLMAMSPPYPRTNTHSLQFVVNPTNAAGYQNQDTMFWQAALLRESTNNPKGNMVVVGYLVQRDLQANSKNSRFQLRRVYSTPTDTDYQLYSSNSWIPDLTNYAPASSDDDTTAAQKGWVADGVLGMWIQCLDSGGYLLTNSATNSSCTPLFGMTNAVTNSYPTNYPYTRMPAFVQVTLVCIGRQEVSRVINVPTGANAATAATFLTNLSLNNPRVKSASSFSRTFRLPCSD